MRLVGTDQEDKVPVDQPLHIVSRDDGNMDCSMVDTFPATGSNFADWGIALV